MQRPNRHQARCDGWMSLLGSTVLYSTVHRTLSTLCMCTIRCHVRPLIHVARAARGGVGVCAAPERRRILHTVQYIGTEQCIPSACLSTICGTGHRKVWRPSAWAFDMWTGGTGAFSIAECSRVEGESSEWESEWHENRIQRDGGRERQVL